MSTRTLPIKVRHAQKYEQIAVDPLPSTDNELVDALREWDRRMQRAFKGIVTRRARHRAMQRAGL